VLTQNSAYVSTIYCDPADTIWFGTAAGLFRQPADESHPGSWQAKVNFIVTSIYDDRQGNLWLGGLTPGLVQFRLSDGRVTHFRKRDGLFDGFLSKVLGDDQGNLWISTDHGIYSVRVRALEDFADGNSTFIPSRRFDLGDGMKTTVASDPGSQPAGARTPDGRLWFATVKGVVAVDPGHLMRNLLIPPVYVESVAADGVERRLGNSLEIAPGVKAIEIHYTALSLQIPERVRFRYQLEGFDHDWVDAGTRRVAYYMNLPPGTYRFHVIACNNDGLWNELGSIVTLVLKPHFYQTRLFFVACILLALLVAAGANMSYTRVIRERAKYLSTLVEERTAQLVESHRELEQLAHFDALTSLPNRRKFVEDFRKVLAQRRGREDGFALLLIDFDRFKKINDTFGHDAGDAFLVEASKRLSMVVRSSDAVARLGGDEFAVLLTGGHDEAVIATVCDRIVESFTTPVYFAGVDITTTVSVGVAVCPQHGNSEDELYKSADLALYDAKRMGRSKWRRYGQEAQERPSEPGVAASGAHGSTG
jgi:diguanylate cyclase (GGDEF)-like protein